MNLGSLFNGMRTIRGGVRRLMEERLSVDSLAISVVVKRDVIFL